MVACSLGTWKNILSEPLFLCTSSKAYSLILRFLISSVTQGPTLINGTAEINNPHVITFPFLFYLPHVCCFFQYLSKRWHKLIRHDKYKIHICHSTAKETLLQPTANRKLALPKYRHFLFYRMFGSTLLDSRIFLCVFDHYKYITMAVLIEIAEKVGSREFLFFSFFMSTGILHKSSNLCPFTILHVLESIYTILF